MKLPEVFNIRVYGILIKNGKVLTTREKYRNKSMIKFPGGGVTPGEGILECLVREWKEETGWDLDSVSHYHTTEEFVRSAFDPNEQIISIYYKVRNKSGQNPDPLPPNKNQDDKITCFQWENIKLINPQFFTFPVDKIVADKLKDEERIS